MSGPPASTAGTVTWLLRPLGRLFASLVAGAASVLVTTSLPRETRIILSLDVFLLTFVALTYVLMSVITGEQCAVLGRQRAPFRHTGFVASVIATVVGLGAIAVMLHSQKNHGEALKTVHLGGSLLALVLGWIAAQMVIAVQYMRLYYAHLDTSSPASAEPALQFPGKAPPDLWDFMYYSFTIAMCYQTSDVSISGSAMRRLTLMHAIYSFFFVAAVIGFVVNVLSNLG
jgi:uncharacterized membrane protein